MIGPWLRRRSGGLIVAVALVLLALVASLHTALPEPTRRHVPPAACRFVPGPAGGVGQGAVCLPPRPAGHHPSSSGDA